LSGIHLCTDSSALLPEGESARLGVTVVPVRVALDGEPYEGDADDFYDRVSAGGTATTSTPSPGALLEAYRAAAGLGASEVLSLHLDARVSGIVAVAELAAREAPVPVIVVDTLTTSFGVTLCVRAAADAVARGVRAAEAAEIARERGARLRNVFVTGGVAGSRVGATRGWSVHRLVGSRVESGVEHASPGDAIAEMAERILDPAERHAVAVGHASARTEPWADELASRLEGDALVTSVERYRVGPSVGAHTGPLAFGAFWRPAQ
jgi:fatty acid-binding protein DegV